MTDPLDPSATYQAARAALLADGSRTGQSFARALSARTDDWLRALYEQAAGTASDLALVAVGGYGRGELCPGSDLDVLLVHGRARRGQDLATVADRIWYPVWDANVPLGHAVRTPREALDLAAEDLETATALLDLRILAGDEALATDLADRVEAAWRKRTGPRLAALLEGARQRHTRAGEVAFLLEPDLKLGRGGLRDAHTVRWAVSVDPTLDEGSGPELDAAYDTLLAVRIELHRLSGRRSDVLTLQEQDAVAAALGDVDADACMARVADAARTIAWALDDVEHAVEGGSGRRAGRRVAVPGEAGIVRDDDVVALAPDVDPRADPAVLLRLAAVAAATGARIDRGSLVLLAERMEEFPDPWPAGAVDDLVRVLRSGPPALGVLDLLDRFGLLVRLLPEWAAVRCKPQRNALHRFTVDRHLLEAAIEAAARAERVTRPDLLVLGGLLHDIGKGFPGDHTEAGMTVLGRVGPRLGLPPADVETLVALCRLHLLLPAVATRRDLDDEATIAGVVEAVGSVEILELLAALTEADALATGPAAWSPWKAELVDDLVRRTRRVLEGGSAAEVTRGGFPTPDQLASLRAGQARVDGTGDRLTVVARDRPGLFSRVAGVLTIHGLDVVSAGALSSDEGWALEHFQVARTASTIAVEIDWPRVVADIEAALAGRLAVAARVAARAQRYRPRHRGAVAPPRVTFDDSSATATVLEVHAPDGVGALYRITRALAELELDLRVAKVETLGDAVVDAFYVVDAEGRRITDADQRREIERAVLHALDPD